jgi:hypothetical protein
MATYNLEKIIQKQYPYSLSSLKETSLDDRTITFDYYLCNNKTLKVFDFDKIKDKVYQNLKGYKSPDTIYIKNKKVYIIEFKNQNPCDIDSQDLKDKFKMSVDFFINQIKYSSDYEFIFCLVYKKQSQSKENQRYKQGLQNQVCCSLDDLNRNSCNLFYKNIITKDITFYKKNFNELKCK